MDVANTVENSTPRNIVIFCDGTWNSPEDEEYGQPTQTNVHKLYMACLDQAESRGTQITWYQPGVGTEGGAFQRAWEGATGIGIGTNIRRGYAAIAAHYQGTNDKIFLIGFSRGAFAARSIAGMIQNVGLLKNPTRKAVKEVYKVYRKAKNEADSIAETRRTREDMHSNVRIHCIGVWDTVGALGLSMWGWSFTLRPLFRNKFHRISPNLITDHVFHALGIDEKRTSFVPLVWHDTGDPRAIPTGKTPPYEVKVEEAWFRGVHSDIGGGYADAGLSDIALAWMVEKLRGVGLLLRPQAPRCSPNVCGRVHNSSRGPLWANVATWPRWTPLRTLAEGATSRSYLHESVRDRERVAANHGIVEKERLRLKVGQSCDVTIRARYLWEYTGMVLEKYAEYELTATGFWQDLRDTPVGPEGQDPSDESWLKILFRWARRKVDARWMALIALPNKDFGWNWKELGVLDALYYLLIEDPKEFTSQQKVIGKSCRLSIGDREEAMLWCFANDMWKYYENNTGSVVLRIERIS